jgi:hypothetical protein
MDLFNVFLVPVQVSDATVIVSRVKQDEVSKLADLEAPPDTK